MGQELDFLKLLAGLGIFLYAMSQLEQGLKKLTSNTFRNFLHRSTSGPYSSIFTGVIATAIVQSSSLVNLIVLAFVGAGIIPLINAISMVIGSNLGTTFTGWIVALLGFKLDLNAITLPLLGLGGLGHTLLKNKWQSWCQFIIGLSLLLIGLDLMKTSVIGLGTQVDLKSFADFPIIFFLFIGLILTGIIQSSSATMIITLSALNAQVISLPAAAAVIIGADLGTTSTVLLGSLQGAASKRRVAMAHVLFNLTVDSIAFILITPSLYFISHIIGLQDSLYTLVMFHTLFNLIGLIFFIPLLKPFSQFLKNKIKEDSTEIRQFINEVPANVSDAALQAMKLEARRLVQMTIQYNLRSLEINKHALSLTDNEMSYLELDFNHIDYADIKYLEGEIIKYAIDIQSKRLEHNEVKQIEILLNAVRHAVYSAKSLKDIHEDLNLFTQNTNDEITTQFICLKKHTTEIYSVAIRLINKHHDFDYFTEELQNLKSKLKSFYQTFLQKIYHRRLLSVKEVELSTLMNVNRELRASCEAILTSIAYAWHQDE